MGEEFKRKLTTILSADVSGYSRLMADNEEETVRTLKSYRKVMESLITKFSGRLVDNPGDNMLAQFESVVDALRCAWDIQQEIKSRNTDLADNRRMTFRIGVNLGDVIEEEGRIYGDGVNVAARLESLADAGGISISSAVYNHVKKKLPFKYEDQGEQTVKNIDEPVQVYRVVMESELPSKESVKPKSMSNWRRNVAIAIGIFIILLAGAAGYVWDTYFRIPYIESLTGQNEEFKLPDGPSIAVLPFDNMSGDPEQEYFSDGLTENIITSLSYNPKLFVIARNSSFHFKGKSPKIQEVAEELGVQYVLEGSFQKSDDTVRVTAQLIDADTGRHLWADRYDRKLKSFFTLQDEIAEKIFTALRVKLTDGERANVYTKYSPNLEFNLKMMRALNYVSRINPETTILARHEAEQALAIAPEHPGPYSMLAITYLADMYYSSNVSYLNSLAQATKLAKKALDIDKNNPEPYLILSMLSTMRGNFEQAIDLVKQAIALNHNYDFAYYVLSFTYTCADDTEKGLDFIKKAIHLNPIPPGYYLELMGFIYSMLGQYKEAIAVLKKAIDREPDNFVVRLTLSATYSMSGHDEGARREASEVLRISPNYSLEESLKGWPFKNPEWKKRYTDALHKAGLK